MKPKYKKYLFIIIALGIGLVLGSTLFSSGNDSHSDHSHTQSEDSKVWTCSMHPQIRQDESGQCPICGMDLVPASQVSNTIDPDAIQMSKTARDLAQVQTTAIGIKNMTSNLEFSGQLVINQNQSFSISTNYKARVEHLYVNDEGESITDGQIIAELYAPDIQVLQQELNLAKRQNKKTLLNTITQKINNLELTRNEVESMKNAKLNLRAPQSGIVTELKIQQGDNLMADQTLMIIADLSTLWAEIDIYENDLNTINIGDELLINTPNNESLTGRVSFVSPVLDESSRSAKARIVIDNTDSNLKPGVFITAQPVEKTMQTETEQKLMVPNSAVLWTGKRSVVYKEIQNETGVF